MNSSAPSQEETVRIMPIVAKMLSTVTPLSPRRS
jgi:hypothetical protein